MALKGTFRVLPDLFNLFGDYDVPPRNDKIRDVIASANQVNVLNQAGDTEGAVTLTLTPGSVLVRADAADGSIDVVLPDAAEAKGALILVKRLDDNTETSVTLVHADIDGTTDSLVVGQYDLTGVVSNGASYDIVQQIVNA